MMMMRRQWSGVDQKVCLASLKKIWIGKLPFTSLTGLRALCLMTSFWCCGQARELNFLNKGWVPQRKIDSNNNYSHCNENEKGGKIKLLSRQCLVLGAPLNYITSANLRHTVNFAPENLDSQTTCPTVINISNIFTSNQLMPIFLHYIF